MQQDKIEKVSDALAAAWRDGGSVNISEDLWPTDLEESLAIQDAFISAWIWHAKRPDHYNRFCSADSCRARSGGNYAIRRRWRVWRNPNNDRITDHRGTEAMSGVSVRP